MLLSFNFGYKMSEIWGGYINVIVESNKLFTI